jgi:hypothetical protein
MAIQENGQTVIHFNAKSNTVNLRNFGENVAPPATHEAIARTLSETFGGKPENIRYVDDLRPLSTSVRTTTGG